VPIMDHASENPWEKEASMHLLIPKRIDPDGFILGIPAVGWQYVWARTAPGNSEATKASFCKNYTWSYLIETRNVSRLGLMSHTYVARMGSVEQFQEISQSTTTLLSRKPEYE
jgi:hypothetical protein